MAAGLARGPGTGARTHPPQPGLTFPSCASPPGCGKQQTRPPCPQRSGSFHGARDPGAALCPKALWLSQCSDGATCIGSAESPTPGPVPHRTAVPSQLLPRRRRPGPLRTYSLRGAGRSAGSQRGVLLRGSATTVGLCSGPWKGTKAAETARPDGVRASDHSGQERGSSPHRLPARELAALGRGGPALRTPHRPASPFRAGGSLGRPPLAFLQPVPLVMAVSSDGGPCTPGRHLPATGPKSTKAKQIRNKIIIAKRINTLGEKWIINSSCTLCSHNKWPSIRESRLLN